VTAVLAVLACVSVWPAPREPVRWTPDALYYEARVLEIRGSGHEEAMTRTFRGPLSAELRARDPQKTGNPAWVRYNEPFYHRRVAVPLVGAALYPLTGSRSLLYVSLAGFVAAVLATFWLLLLRFRMEVAAGVAAATAFLPPLVNHSSFPLTDSWGLALEIAAFITAALTLERGRRWLVPWVAVIALLSLVRDSTWIPLAAVAWCAFRYRSRRSISLLASGVVAALPAVVLFRSPVRDLLALLVNQSQVPSDTSWTFIATHYPRAVLELVRANVGFLRRGEWYTALYFASGLAALLLLGRRDPGHKVWRSLLTAGAVAGVGYVLAAPVFSAFRLELVFVPFAAYGLALIAEEAAVRVAARAKGTGGLDLRLLARIRR